MDPEIKHEIEEIKKVTEESNYYVRKMYRMYRIGRAVKIAYWLLVIGIAIGAFYFIQPYIDGIVEFFTGVNSATERIINLGR